MKLLHTLAVVCFLFLVQRTTAAQNSCALMSDRSVLANADKGEPSDLDHFKLTEGRLRIREFLWQHWHAHTKGFAEARIRTMDAGTMTVFYIIRSDVQGKWGIDVVLKRQRDTSCVQYHADSIVRLPIAKPEEDYPSQTMGFWPLDRLPAKLIADEEIREPRTYQIQLVASGKPMGDVL